MPLGVMRRTYAHGECRSRSTRVADLRARISEAEPAVGAISLHLYTGFRPPERCRIALPRHRISDAAPVCSRKFAGYTRGSGEFVLLSRRAADGKAVDT